MHRIMQPFVVAGGVVNWKYDLISLSAIMSMVGGWVVLKVYWRFFSIQDCCMDAQIYYIGRVLVVVRVPL